MGDLPCGYNACPGASENNPYAKGLKAEEECRREKEEQRFPLEKILAISAREYCDSVGKTLSDYTLRGVHGDYLQKFRDNVPMGAEVVTDLRVLSPKWEYLVGTALIPRS